MSESKTYLGDAVYADVEVWGMGPCVILTTEDGIRATNRIVLEPEVLQALVTHLERVKLRLERATKEKPDGQEDEEELG